MQSLPIDAIQSEFHQQLRNNHLVVEAETGSGKSTRLPIWASEKGRVLVVEPRRIACTSLAQYLAEQSDDKFGERIGYAIKLENRYSAQTNVVFVTPGVALRWFAEDRLEQFDIVMVDEFHERRWDTDLLVSMLKQADQHRLIITSATLETDRLKHYIGGTKLTAEGRVYPVAVSYRALDSNQLPNGRNIEQQICKEVINQIDQSPGDILVFLPGRKEIAQCLAQLKNQTSALVLPLHASVSDEDRKLALSVNRKKKVVLSTNVAETSLTIPNVSTVIDSGLERRTVQRNGRTALMLTHISQASAKQRMGRAGRVMNGHCIRLYGKHAALETMTPPEFQRESLIEPMLTAAMCGYSLERLSWLDPIPSKSLDLAKSSLESMSAIDKDGDITEHGKRLYPLPIDALHADLLTRLDKKALKEAIIDLTAAMSVPSSLFTLSQNSESIEHLNQQEKYGCDGNLLIKLVRGEKFDGVVPNLEAIKEAQGLAAQMREIFHLPMLEVASRYSHRDLVTQIAKLQPELVFLRREKRRDALGNGKMEVLPARGSRFQEQAEAAVVLSFHSLPGRGVKQTLDLATVMLPISIADVVEAGVGEWHQGETEVENGQAYSLMTLHYANRVIATKRVSAIGELAHKPLIDEVLAGGLLPNFAEQRIQQINLWKLYVELGLAESNEHGDVTFESWFSALLTDLEISSIEDLMLFSAEDFEFEGIPYWEYQEFAETYPYQLTLGDLNLGVEYHVAKKLVIVYYLSGLRKGDPKRWELPRWTGWRIRYRKASRVIDIK
ncbi:helicase-related protein [uncultured Vibrio sp.]|uniref:helicase-related protein n=1 Tax=uncultured Vibrio sp. TaxID=114054 RepID=UPI000913A203|nr:helicase-related protein [uncultured Vibrio sp.]OIQ26621.1 MAG: DEAD/DEAH box helicase [Vibrio sp. MedPE-SWchi]